ncbi:hypothetical protein BRADI_3g37115v3 [Brachypodium distachyon]|uniref:Uncharacterized protein n=1 Tax=Brachypodium distachyon TaxID=15368 RepID=A0A0Q3IDE5_BRADI|nr:hypothetical protein BRADI_3g37115v3 [Brachypodium distachyon]
MKDLSRSPLTHEKKNMHKRHAKDNVSTQKTKKIRIDKNIQAKYHKYIAKKHKINKPKEGEDSPPFVKIGDFFVSYSCLQASLKPRGKLDNQVMSLLSKHLTLQLSPLQTPPD